MSDKPTAGAMPAELNIQYRDAVSNACVELSEMVAPTATWEKHAAVIITKHLTPLFRELIDDRKRAETALPELVEALKNLIDAAQSDSPPDSREYALVKARDALAKAKGEK